MARKYQNSTLQTNPRHDEEKPQNTNSHKTIRGNSQKLWRTYLFVETTKYQRRKFYKTYAQDSGVMLQTLYVHVFGWIPDKTLTFCKRDMVKNITPPLNSNSVLEFIINNTFILLVALNVRFLTQL